MKSFENHTAVITGAAGTLGRAVVQRFHDLGARTVATDLSADMLSDVAGADATYVCDLTDENSARETFAAIHRDQGRIDVLANIAGGFAMGPRVEETTAADWRAMLEINAVTAWLACKCVLPFMRAEGFGRIVNIGARAARRPGAKMAPYCVSKAAVVTLTEVLALECAAAGITANCVLPGTIDTPRNRADMPDADHSRWVPPEELAVAIAHLADPANRAVNGVVMPVYGRS